MRNRPICDHEWRETLNEAGLKVLRCKHCGGSGGVEPASHTTRKVER